MNTSDMHAAKASKLRAEATRLRAQDENHPRAKSLDAQAAAHERLEQKKKKMTTNKIQIKVGDRVALNSNTEDSGQEGKVTKILQDGDLEIDFDDGEEGCYRQSEVEVLDVKNERKI